MGHLRCHRDQVRGGGRSAAVGDEPGAEDGEEGLVTDGEAQGVEGARPAAVDRGSKVEAASVLRTGRLDPNSGDSSSVSMRSPVGAVVVLSPELVGVGGEALVEPDVRPVAGGHRVAEPLVGELVGQGVGVAGVDPVEAEERPGLGLEGHAEARRHHDDAGVVVGVLAEGVGVELEDLVEQVEAGPPDAGRLDGKASTSWIPCGPVRSTRS